MDTYAVSLVRTVPAHNGQPAWDSRTTFTAASLEEARTWTQEFFERMEKLTKALE